MSRFIFNCPVFVATGGHYWVALTNGTVAYETICVVCGSYRLKGG